MYFNESDVHYAEFQMWKHKVIYAKKRGEKPPEPPEWYAKRAKWKGNDYVYENRGRPSNRTTSMRGVW